MAAPNNSVANKSSFDHCIGSPQDATTVINNITLKFHLNQSNYYKCLVLDLNIQKYILFPSALQYILFS